MDCSLFLIFLGGYDGSSRNNIFEYNHLTEEWMEIGTMVEERSNHAVEVVDPADFSQWCN